MSKKIWGIIITVIGLFIIGFHLLNYIDLISRLRILASLVGRDIDMSSIILEIMLGFILIISGIGLLLTIKEKEEKNE